MSGHQVPLDKLALVYRKIRAKIDDLTKTYEEELSRLKDQQEALRNEMREMLKELGVQSVRTTEGTVTMMVKTRYSTTDWDSFKKFVVEHNALDLYEKRIHQTNMRAYLEENPEQIPPGLNSESYYDVVVRKPTQ